MCLLRSTTAVTLSGVAEDAITIVGVDLAPYGDGPGLLALTGYDEVLAVSRDSATWSSQWQGCSSRFRGPKTNSS